MTTFYICRHGQTQYNQQGRLSGWTDTPLTDEGVRNAQSTVAKLTGLHFDRIISSDLGRAFVTAYLITRGLGINTEIERNQALREVSYGDLVGMATAKATAEYGVDKITNFIAPNGESLAQMQARVIEFLNELDDHNPSQTIMLISHEGVISAINTYFSGTDLGTHMDTKSYPHDYVGKFTIENGKIGSFADCTGE